MNLIKFIKYCFFHRTVLHIAAEKGNAEIAKLLFKKDSALKDAKDDIFNA